MIGDLLDELLLEAAVSLPFVDIVGRSLHLQTF